MLYPYSMAVIAPCEQRPLFTDGCKDRTHVTHVIHSCVPTVTRTWRSSTDAARSSRPWGSVALNMPTVCNDARVVNLSARSHAMQDWRASCWG